MSPVTKLEVEVGELALPAMEKSKGRCKDEVEVVAGDGNGDGA